MKNIGWYTRNGHLDFLARLSQRLKGNGNNISSYYVCNSKAQQDVLNRKYNIMPWVLSDFLVQRKDFFHISKDILREYEKDYDIIPLRRLLWSEMFEKKLSEEKMIFHLIAHFEFWENFLIENNIEGMVSERPSILSTSILWVLCKKYNIQFLDFINIGIDGRIVFTSSWYGDIDHFREEYNRTIVKKDTHEYEKAIKYLDKMTTKPEKPEYILKNLTTGKIIKGNKLYISLPKIGNIFTLPKRLKNSITRRQYYIGATIYQSLALFIVTYFKSLVHRLINIFEKDIDLSKKSYFIFPLHALHEWSDYPWMGLRYSNTIALIQEIASCLPLEYQLYVKEHTTNFPEKSFSFYRYIKKIPQVRLIDRHEDTYKLITNSEGIITLGGTMGWEAFLMGKPVVILGKAWYRHCPGIFMSPNNENLVELLQKIKNLPIATEEEKIKAIIALNKLSFKAERYPVKNLITPENIEKYMEPFESWLIENVGATKSK